MHVTVKSADAAQPGFYAQASGKDVQALSRSDTVLCHQSQGSPMETTSKAATPPSNGTFLFGSTLIVALWSALAWLFGRRQELWVDETTQLTGLTLAPGEMTAWLAGVGPGRFSVPDDRMPPLSYWVGWGWSRIWGLSENSMRALSATLVALSVLLIMRAARDAWGNAAGYLAGLTLVLSPAIVITGVEIRAYPLLLLTATSAFYFLLRWSNSVRRSTPDRRAWVGLLLSTVAAAYTHFFGLSLAGGVWLAIAFILFKERRSYSSLLVFTAVVGASTIGLLPFVRAAFRMSTNGAPGESHVVTDLARLVYRLLGGNPTSAAYPIVLACVLLATMALLAVALTRVRVERYVLPLSVTLIAGIAAATLAQTATSTFVALAPNYNIWMVPPISLLMASALAATGGWQKWVGRVAAALMLLGLASASLVLVLHPEVFSHTAADRVAVRLDGTNLNRVVVVHDGAATWGNIYFPLRYRFGGRLAQYLSKVNQDGTVTLQRLPNLSPEVAPKDLPARRVLLVSSRILDGQVLAAFVRDGVLASPNSSPIEAALRGIGAQVGPSENLVAFGSARLTWFDVRP